MTYDAEGAASAVLQQLEDASVVVVAYVSSESAAIMAAIMTCVQS